MKNFFLMIEGIIHCEIRRCLCICDQRQLAIEATDYTVTYQESLSSFINSKANREIGKIKWRTKSTVDVRFDRSEWPVVNEVESENGGSILVALHVITQAVWYDCRLNDMRTQERNHGKVKRKPWWKQINANSVVQNMREWQTLWRKWSSLTDTVPRRMEIFWNNLRWKRTDDNHLEWRNHRMYSTSGVRVAIHSSEGSAFHEWKTNIYWLNRLFVEDINQHKCSRWSQEHIS